MRQPVAVRVAKKAITDLNTGLELRLVQVLRYGPPKSGMGKAVVKASFDVEILIRDFEAREAGLQERKAGLKLAEAKKLFTAWKREHFPKPGARI